MGGSEIQCDIIAKHLLQMGHDPIYFAVNGTRDYEVDYEVHPSKLSVRSLISAIDLYDPDIVYWRFDKRQLLKSALICKYYGVTFIFSASSQRNLLKWGRYENMDFSSLRTTLNTLYNACTRPFKQRINYFGYQLVDGVTVLNSDFLHKIPAEPQVVIHDSMEDNTAEFEWGNPFVVWVANLKPNKNPEKYIQLADRSQLDIDFLMVGNIQNEQYSYIRDGENTPSNFYFLGSKTPTEVNGILKKSLFLVHTCNPEGFGDIFIQAWLMGKPTISLYFDPDDYISKHNIGIVSGDLKSLTSDMETLTQQEELRKRMGERALKVARKNFDPKKNTQNLMKFIKQVDSQI